MSSLVVESPGLLTAVQDLGRPGFGPLGISPSGAADPVALRLGNLLVGNDPGAPTLEMTLLGGTFSFPNGAVIALTGADLGASVDGRSLEMWTPQEILPNAKLVLGPTRNFARAYLAVAGGIQVPAFLGSASTHLLSGLGGLEGRALRKGDVLTLGSPAIKVLQPANFGIGALDVAATKSLARNRWTSGRSFFRRGQTYIFSRSLPRQRGVGPHRPSSRGTYPEIRFARGNDHGRRATGRDSGDPFGPAHHLVRGTTNHWRLSKDSQRHRRGFASPGATSPSRGNSL